MSISQSLFSLVKFNAGKFKSRKQADFLLSHFANGVYATSGKIYNSSFTWLFHADTNGIYLIEKKLKTGIVTHWELSESSANDSLKACDKSLKQKAFIKTNNFLQYQRNKCQKMKSALLEMICKSDIENDALLARLTNAHKILSDRITRLDAKFDKLHGFN